MSAQNEPLLNSTPVCFDEELISRYGGRGPRYTSYPTAVQFNDTVTAELYRQNAVASNERQLPLSIYVHIPFCESLCYYCGCNKIVTRNSSRIELYLKNLYHEIAMQGELFSPSRKVEQLHFGGGTPTYLDAQQLQELMHALDRSFQLDTSTQHEFSIEVDPRTVDAERIKRLAELGFNRLSLGVQDFDVDVQNAVNRVQAPKAVQALVESARCNSFRSVSFDLIYGLPLQTLYSFDNTLDAVIAMRPDRLAVYNYAHLPERFKGQRMINTADIPTAAIKLKILGRTIERLSDAGYHYIGMDHFALPTDDMVTAKHQGTLQRNFQGYSTHRDCDLVGLGNSAVGNIGNVYAQNTLTTREYQACLESGRLPIAKGIVTDRDDRLRASAIQSLMCYGELRFSTFNTDHNINFGEYFAAELHRLVPLRNDGLVELDNDSIVITPNGRLLLRSIACIFDRYFTGEQEQARFSNAI